MELSIVRIILFVQDVEKVSNFYEKNFGMTRISEEPGWIELKSAGCKLGLHKAHGESSGLDSPAKVCFYAEDVEAVRASLESKGLKFGKTFSYGGFKFCDTSDPEGNPVQISSR